MKHKLNKQKGFTLIELMVVIAIIALLSSVVLASLKGAREKAVLGKTVAEMKSLQNALELYKNQFGVYPGHSIFGNYDDDNGLVYIRAFDAFGGTMESFFTTELVNNKLISKVPHAPNYPNNCVSYGQCATNGYILGYSVVDMYSGVFHRNNNTNRYYTCGKDKVKNYFIYFYTNTKTVNLPKLGISNNGVLSEDLNPFMSIAAGGNIYCLAM